MLVKNSTVQTLVDSAGQNAGRSQGPRPRARSAARPAAAAAAAGGADRYSVLALRPAYQDDAAGAGPYPGPQYPPGLSMDPYFQAILDRT
jgi:hypothetical protein